VGTFVGLGLLILAVWFFPRLRPPTEILPKAEDWLSWQENLQTFFGLATLTVAAFVWYNSLVEEWTGKLPRLLSCYFFHANQPALICYHAYLAGEADIRAWSQQIAGRQMVGGDLKFRPVVDTRPTELLTDGSAVYQHHQVRFTLTELPPLLANAGKNTGQPVCLVWHPRREESPPQVTSAIVAATAGHLPDIAEWSGRKT